MSDLTFEYVPKSGQKQQNLGPFQPGETKTVSWTTPATGIVEEGKNGLFGVQGQPGSNDSITVVFNKQTKSFIGQGSCSWAFGPGKSNWVPMLPSTEYTATVTSQYGGPAVICSLTAR